LAKQPVSINGAGRTDSGVHALGQVVTFTTHWRHGVIALQNAINANLPKDIAVLKIDVVDSDFHPRFSAKRRAYVYYVYNDVVRSPTRRTYSWHVSSRLDIDKMNVAAASLVGIHDFATFGQPPQGVKTVREMFVAEWKQQGKYLLFHIEANAFLYRMVRSIVGSLIAVGSGKWSVADFVGAFNACDRTACGKVAPPHGLFLVSVTYEEE
jgi:tRNA pseudouridine38-40 synthase